MRHCKRHCAFTLLELLVVVAVVGLLAALLLPTLARAKARGRAAACKSNLRQVGMALQLYVSDHSFYPYGDATFTMFTGNWHESGVQYFTVALSRYIPFKNKVTRCPEYEDLGTFRVTGTEAIYVVEGGYGYNSFGGAAREAQLGLGGLGHPDGTVRWQSESGVVRPSEMIAFADVSDAYGAWLSPNELRPPGFVWSSRPSKRHRGGANVLFCDGHVEFGKQALWIEASDHRQKLWNNDNRPHPENW